MGSGNGPWFMDICQASQATTVVDTCQRLRTGPRTQTKMAGPRQGGRDRRMRYSRSSSVTEFRDQLLKDPAPSEYM